jgi:hypothetical protein
MYTSWRKGAAYKEKAAINIETDSSGCEGILGGQARGSGVKRALEYKC